MAARRTTQRQRRGAWAEDIAAAHLGSLGWRVMGRNLRVGRDEIDLLALEPGPPPALVVVEVRGLHSKLFGAPEERVDRAKVGRLYRAAAALRSAGCLPGGERLPALSWRVDLVLVDAREGPPRLRHMRAIEPP
ncbi:MAG TPA: YraN family protein [Candidatus Limnocylindria bacterium]|nr:YraN family protein [Candidatus Limnocylindria bacterium]